MKIMPVIKSRRSFPNSFTPYGSRGANPMSCHVANYEERRRATHVAVMVRKERKHGKQHNWQTLALQTLLLPRKQRHVLADVLVRMKLLCMGKMPVVPHPYHYTAVMKMNRSDSRELRTDLVCPFDASSEL